MRIIGGLDLFFGAGGTMLGHGTGVKYVMDAAPGLPALAAHLQSAALLMA